MPVAVTAATIAMSLLTVGVNHASCPLAIRERLASLGAQAASRALLAAGWKENVVLSTCNRFEVYAAGGGAGATPHCAPSGRTLERMCAAAAGELAAFLDDFAGCPVSSHVYRRSGAAAAGHLFRVACGLDSLVFGESEILGQVKQSYETARDAGLTGKRTNVLFQRALFVGKAVRSRTDISAGQVSVASVAVELARRIFGGLLGSKVLILGAGEMAEKTARHLADARVERLYIANRTWENARRLSALLGAETVHFDDFPRKLAEVDIVIASAGSPGALITRAMVESALAQRGGRALFIIDIAMPRNVSDDVHSIDGAYLYALDDLQGVVAENRSRRVGVLAAAEEIVAAETEKFGAWLASLESGNEISLRHSERADVHQRRPHPLRAVT